MMIIGRRTRSLAAEMAPMLFGEWAEEFDFEVVDYNAIEDPDDSRVLIYTTQLLYLGKVTVEVVIHVMRDSLNPHHISITRSV